MYVVYQDGKRCSEYKISDWKEDTFATKREAEVFAFAWAYPVPFAQCEEFAPEMDVGVEYDYSIGEEQVLMKIEEVSK